MTRYETGFLTKCAEYGLDVGTSIELMKIAVGTVPAAGVASGAGPAVAPAATAAVANPTAGVSALPGVQPAAATAVKAVSHGVRNAVPQGMGGRIVNAGKRLVRNPLLGFGPALSQR